VGGRYVGVSSTVTDLGGVQYVEYFVNGVFAGRATSAPYSMTLDMTRFGGVRTHSVQAVATDLVGRTASSTKSVQVLNVTVPTITRMSDGPDPFYPIKHDHYRDTMRVSYRLAERAYVKLQILDSSGVVVRELAGWRRGGANSFVWNGRRADGSIVVGTYRYRLIANDGAYNVYTTGLGSTKIRSYYLKRISRSRVRVVFS
jgi:flagellar hook assembly protein FlgD